MIKALAAAFGLTFVAELGDKTQIAILAMSARYGYLPVFLGAGVAFAVLNAFAVTVGAVVARYVPEHVIRYVAAAVFIIFGVLSFRGEEEEKPQAERKASRSPFISALLVVSLMELGDKTQLALIALSGRYGYPLFVFIGGTLALWLTSFIGAIAGEGLARVVPFRYIRWISGVLFIVFGILMAAGVF